MKYVSYNFGYIVKIQPFDDGNTFVTIARDVNDIYTYIRLVVSNKTLILNQECNEIQVSDLSIGNCILVYHSNAMTASIPPQTNAFIMEVKF